MFVEEVEGILNAINEFTRGASCINVHKIWMNYLRDFRDWWIAFAAVPDVV